METGIDCMKYRKSTHLAGVDVEAIIAEKGICELTIKLAYYEKGVDVSGHKTDGYFLRFEEPVKEMVVNSGNRKRIADMVKKHLNCSSVDSRNIGNWAGLKIKLIFDENVKMKGEKVGGIVVDVTYNQPKKMTLDEAKALFAKVNSRESFVKCMKDCNEFMKNPEIIAICTELSTKYPKP